MQFARQKGFLDENIPYKKGYMKKVLKIDKNNIEVRINREGKEIYVSGELAGEEITEEHQ